MPGYEEYLARGVDPATARAWADADADADDEFEEADPELSAAKYVVRQQPSLITSIAPQTAASLGIGSEQAQTLNETLHDLSLRTGPAPNPAIGRDPTGMVSLHVDREHTPFRIELRNDWDEKLSAETLPTAIFGAYRAALDIQHNEARDAASHEKPPQPATLRDLIGPLDAYRDGPRSLDSFRSSVYAACDRANRLVAELDAEAAALKLPAAPAEPRTVTLQLDGPWLVGCQINAAWASEVAAARIMNEFAVALQQARESAHSAAQSSLEGEKQALLAELGNLTREGIAALQFMGESIR
jgi:hypothetical protein